ncbi:uncharacterized protein LOC121515532 [Cheilinus undulatus]|uniref:uncharacterized protein LOC121515532 n=1 Tax=Cheilinus undulatus TaxID=241271 RepID=UPI001BD3A5B0|nr:uncharacterized protein LOC121515532 [Cheilinus undulatus]
MSDIEDTDSFLESWISPGKRKRRKGSKKGKKCQETKNKLTASTDEHAKKKKRKKCSKFKEAMKGRKEKKKEKKKKKRRLAFEPNDSAVLTQGRDAQAQSTSKPETLNLQSSNKLNSNRLTQNSKKKTKRKKKVLFDSSPAYIRVKRPKFVSSSQQSPTESLISEKETLRDIESCSQVTVMGHSQNHNNDSQCTSDDINSQDIFITQKTFRAPPSQPSSDETFENDKTFPAVTQIEQHHEEPFKCPDDPQFHHHHREAPRHTQSTETIQVPRKEEEEDALFSRAKPSPQSWMQLNTNHATKKEGSCSISAKHRGLNPYLDEPVVVSLSPEVKKIDQLSSSSDHQSPRSLQVSQFPRKLMTNASTQTENFFTTEVSSYLNFCKKMKEMVHFESLEPLDLSFAKMTRKDLTYSSVASDLHLSCSSDMKGIEVQEKPSRQHPYSESTEAKGETALSPTSQSDNKSVDTSTSSEDNEQPYRNGKLDLVQVRMVQTKLNESFFFKTKGDGKSPRPESPLMKLAQSSREMKSKKGH